MAWFINGALKLETFPTNPFYMIKPFILALQFFVQMIRPSITLQIVTRPKNSTITAHKSGFFDSTGCGK